mgnify:CR=1 FL=1
MKGYCRNGEFCNYAHAKHELRTPHSIRTRPCHFYMKGNCKYGENCKFSHGDQEEHHSIPVVETKSCIESKEVHLSTNAYELLDDDDTLSFSDSELEVSYPEYNIGNSSELCTPIDTKSIRRQPNLSATYSKITQTQPIEKIEVKPSIPSHMTILEYGKEYHYCIHRSSVLDETDDDIDEIDDSIDDVISEPIFAKSNMSTRIFGDLYGHLSRTVENVKPRYQEISAV